MKKFIKIFFQFWACSYETTHRRYLSDFSLVFENEISKISNTSLASERLLVRVALIERNFNKFFHDGVLDAENVKIQHKDGKDCVLGDVVVQVLEAGGNFTTA